MICLLRHFGGLPTPIAGFDSLPSRNDTNISDDLAILKYYRNITAHSEHGIMTDTDFVTETSGVVNSLY